MPAKVFLIGAPKAGSTFLASLLDQHPEICVSKPKEPKYFSSQCGRGEKWYASAFSHKPSATVHLDASTEYSLTTSFPHCLGRIYSNAPEAKFIYLVRNPFQRIESQWIENSRRWKREKSFESAVLNDETYIEATLYWKVFSDIAMAFGETSILLILFDELVTDPGKVAQRCFQHASVDPLQPVDEKQTEKNEREQKKRPRKGMRVVMSLYPEAFRKAYMSLPAWAQSQILGIAKKKIQPPKWTPRSRYHVIDRVFEDNERILSRMGLPAKVWFDCEDRPV